MTPARDEDGIRSVVQGHARDSVSELPALSRIQEQLEDVSDHDLDSAAAHFSLSADEVGAVAADHGGICRTPSQTRVIRVCAGLSCRASGAHDILEAVQAEAARAGLDVCVEIMSCAFYCASAPTIQVDGQYRRHTTVPDAVHAVRSFCAIPV